MTLPAAPLRRAVLSAAALAVLAAPLPSPATAATAARVDSGLSAVLRSALDARRRAAGLEPLFARSAYQTQAATIATRIANGSSAARPADGTPATWLSWDVAASTLAADNRAASEEMGRALDAVLRYPLHTDGGWAVAVSDLGNGMVRLGLAGLVGWPAPAVSANSGCSGAGYCWATRGLNPHLPWTRNRLTIHLSTAGMPAAAPSLVQAAIARLDAIPGVGAHVAYGGTTSATDPGPGRRFLVQWRASTACGSSVRACTVTSSQGSYKLVYSARIAVVAGRYSASPGTEPWVGTLTHELAHALGLGHYDAAYAGSYQLMRTSGGPTTSRAGDVNGLRTLNRPGGISVRLATPAPAYRAGSTARVTATTSSTGLGGVRNLAVQCYDRHGTLRTVARRAGLWDITSAARAVTWTVGGGSAYDTRCRALATSKGDRGTSGWVAVRLGG